MGIYPDTQERGTDMTVKFCKTCSRCWEKTEYQSYTGNRHVIYYQKGSLPTIGKMREICKKCSGKQKQNKSASEIKAD